MSVVQQDKSLPVSNTEKCQDPKMPLDSAVELERGEKKEAGLQSVKTQEKMKRKWSREAVKAWLCFILSQVVQQPFGELEYVLSICSHQEKIYGILQKHIGTKSAKECEIFTKKSLLFIKKTEKMCLADWAANKLKRQTDQQSKRLVKAYNEIKENEREYMEVLEEFKEVETD